MSDSKKEKVDSSRNEKDVKVEETQKQKVGIVMPISETSGYLPGHWNDVLSIIKEVVGNLDLECDLVSENNEVGLIQKDIIRNLYLCDLIICDVSSKNPNVMFELGIRLTFDKPTIIIKDDSTSYTFDISTIRHINYRKDLRYTDIEDFKNTLSKTIRETLEASKKGGYSTFLGNFQIHEIPQLGTVEASISEVILEELKSLRNEISSVAKPIQKLYTKSNDNSSQLFFNLLESNRSLKTLWGDLLSGSFHLAFMKGRNMEEMMKLGFTRGEFMKIENEVQQVSVSMTFNEPQSAIGFLHGQILDKVKSVVNSSRLLGSVT